MQSWNLTRDLKTPYATEEATVALFPVYHSVCWHLSQVGKHRVTAAGLWYSGEGGTICTLNWERYGFVWKYIWDYLKGRERPNYRKLLWTEISKSTSCFKKLRGPKGIHETGGCHIQLRWIMIHVYSTPVFPEIPQVFSTSADVNTPPVTRTNIHMFMQITASKLNIRKETQGGK